MSYKYCSAWLGAENGLWLMIVIFNELAAAQSSALAWQAWRGGAQSMRG